MREFVLGLEQNEVVDIHVAVAIQIAHERPIDGRQLAHAGRQVGKKRSQSSTSMAPSVLRSLRANGAPPVNSTGKVSNCPSSSLTRMIRSSNRDCFQMVPRSI